MIPSINNIKLLKIIKPTWYYYFQFKNNSKYWVDYRDLSFEKKKHIDFCNIFMKMKKYRFLMQCIKHGIKDLLLKILKLN